MQITAIALDGLSRAQAQLEGSARRIASAPSGDVVDLTKEATDVILAASTYEANLATIRVADEVEQHILDMLA